MRGSGGTEYIEQRADAAGPRSPVRQLCRDSQVYFRARVGLAPDFKACAQLLRSFLQPYETRVSRFPPGFQNRRANSSAIVANSKAKGNLAISDFDLDIICA